MEEYLKYFLKQKEAGLLIFSSSFELSRARRELIETKFVEAVTWQDLLQAFKKGKSAVVVLDVPIQKEMYDCVAQYADRGGELQIMNPGTMKIEQVEFEPDKIHLLLLAKEKDMSKLQTEYGIKDKVGLVERIKS